MAEFSIGSVVKTDIGADVKIKKFLGEGGIAKVYLVEVGEREMVLKWYDRLMGTYAEKLYANINILERRDSPDEAFLWPKCITEKVDGEFGYVMPFVNEGYYALYEILSSPKINFSDYKAIADAAIKITSAFRKLHSLGYSFNNIDDGIFLINPQTGDVKIKGVDYVAPNLVNMGVIGMPKYMAPELVVGECRTLPDTWSDRYSLSVILFMLLFASHPLEGKKWLVPCLTDQFARKLYGEEPVFVFDKEDDSNRPVDGIHVNILNIWPCMPDYIKDAFRNAFSKEALHNPQKRLTESDWLRVLCRFRSDIMHCSCGNDIFIDNYDAFICDECNKIYEIKHVIRLPEYEIPAIKGTRIYRCQIGISNPDNDTEAVALVLENEEARLLLKNLTRTIWQVTTPSGKERKLEPGKCMPMFAGTRIVMLGYTVKILKGE